jgi:hypothetical protein
MQPAPLRRVPPRGRISPFEPQEKDMTETTRHDRIFLQVNEDSPHKFEGDVTWCEDRVHDTDVEYICRELHDQQISNLKVVHSDSIHALQQQLAEREKQLAKTQMYALGKKLLLAEREKQNVLLRDLIDHILNTYHVPRVPRITEALAATADLAGLVVCDAVPVMKVIRNEAGQIMAQSGDGGYFDISTNVGKSFYLAKEKS